MADRPEILLITENKTVLLKIAPGFGGLWEIATALR